MFSSINRLSRVLNARSSLTKNALKAAPRLIHHGVTLTADDFTTVGAYLASRLVDAGADKVFAVPGDYNLILLDKLIDNPKLEVIGNCNELNGGYAADGYARATGFAPFVVTYMVGGLSAINAIAGAYSDDLPVLLISGGPNTNDEPAGNIIHHTIGTKDFYQQFKCFAPIVKDTFVIRHHEEAATMIDNAVQACLLHRKPVYLEIACNLAGARIRKPPPLDMYLPRPESDPVSMQAALKAAVKKIEVAVKPVLLGGVKLRVGDAIDAFYNLSTVMGSAVAVMPDAKGLYPESNELFIGTYWGCVSSPVCAEVVESSDLVIACGPLFNDFTTTGWSTLLNKPKMIIVGENYVEIDYCRFHNVYIAEFLDELRKVVPRDKDMSRIAYDRFRDHEEKKEVPVPPNLPLTLKEFRRQVQEMLTDKHDLIIETGDSWFNGQKLKLPDGCTYNFQCQYGSIGWSVGAALGYQMGTEQGRRVIAMIGDGSFQMTAQEISTMIRYDQPVIIFLLNNEGYTIEVEIHDGPYNNIKNWDYAGLVQAFNAQEGNGIGMHAKTGGELRDCIKKAIQHKHFVLIEVHLDRDDCTAELLEWGSRVAHAGGRPTVDFRIFK
eukprot:CAMPEP_0182437014 /NCGR_PEP_ID=MMETSP1167-20130531/84753_1 /TAXON_ID=2988 /ORGANISM="Mallomonas Sp, Strain CCMP3275" /LENGTH=606 /DNA_ID=CAMNT_0024629769 /DNA_START=25 /DNA_END=1845 /DNA_ORIENTATION=+